METRLTSLEQIMPLPTAGELLAERARPVVAIASSAGAGSAARLMQEHDIGFLVVVDDGKLVGVLSERDLVRRVDMHHPTFVRGIMNARVQKVGPDARVPECLAIMHNERIRHLPVVSGDIVQGVLSIRDLTGALIERHERLLRKLADERVTLLFPSGSY